ncbi:fluoride efflux transporter CrcB [Bacillus massilinigeriensis]|uniref:fluoride efflux transporter CrcB n=1 Tax=Bacillus massilionigeriensis TaxID=1805475 RepID=UPI00096B64FB|nr:fluoride efflux transporter CrcB [Bacillus massilionigeriensis]
MIHILLIGIGGFFGAICRFVISNYGKKLKRQIPVGTLIVNLVGSFLLGFILGLNVGKPLYGLFGTGFMGAFTTFSTFKVDAIMLLNQKQKREFLFYIIITYTVGILLAFFGYSLGKIL